MLVFVFEVTDDNQMIFFSLETLGIYQSCVSEVYAQIFRERLETEGPFYIREKSPDKQIGDINIVECLKTKKSYIYINKYNI